MGQEETLELKPFDVTFLAQDGTRRQFVVLAADLDAAFEFVWDGGDADLLDLGGGGIKDVLSIFPSSLPVPTEVIKLPQLGELNG